jgi:hypothetical protein
MGHAPEIPANALMLISILPFPEQIPINTSFQHVTPTRNMVGASRNRAKGILRSSIVSKVGARVSGGPGQAISNRKFEFRDLYACEHDSVWFPSSDSPS